MLLSSPPPPDALYIGTVCAVLGIGLGLGILRAGPAWHALGIGILFAGIGHWALYAHLQDTTHTAHEVLKIIPLPPTSRFAVPGLWFLGFAVWLYVIRNWMGIRTRRLTVAALWTAVMCQVTAYVAKSGAFDTLPHTSQDAFLDAVRYNATLGHIQFGAQVLEITSLLVVVFAPVVWRMQFTPQNSS